MKGKDIFEAIFENNMEQLRNLLKGAIALFEVYESFIEAGFNDTQAFYLTSEILKGGLSNGKN